MTEKPAANLPGLGYLRSAVRYASRRTPGPATLRHDGVAGVTVTVSSIPDGLANGLLAGTNPIFGLYANMVGPVVGGLLSSSRLMVINSTSATALVAGQALAGTSSDDGSALFLTVMLAGVIAVLFGVLRLGRLTDFVSFSVMTGFISGIAVLLVLSQLPTVSGFESTAEGTTARALDLLRNVDQIHLPSLAVAGFALALVLGLRPTPLNKIASLVAVAVPTTVVLLLSVDDVAMVRDVGEIQGGLPMPRLPDIGDFSVDVVTGAFSIALIALVQGAGVSKTVPNPGGARSNASRDFVAQGAANLGAGLFGGLPVGGSLSGTAVSVLAGARRRWAAIFSGVSMAVIVVGIPEVVSVVVMPSLGALLIVAGVSSVNPSEIVSVWRAGRLPRLAAVTTFVAVLFLPVQVAVGIGVLLSVTLFVNSSAVDVTVIEQVERSGGRVEERAAPKRLPDRRITVLDVYGVLFFAGARKLERLLPSPHGTTAPVVILRLRGRTDFGATLVDVLSDYADQVKAAGGRLYLAGLGKAERERLLNGGHFRASGPVQAYEATPVLGESTRAAYEDAEQWLVGHSDDDSEGTGQE